MTKLSGLDKAIKYFGDQAAMADSLRVTPMAITQWKKRGVPAERAVEIETATDGDVKRHELRPDLFPVPSRPKKSKAA